MLTLGLQPHLVVYALSAFCIWAGYFLLRNRAHRISRAIHSEAVDAGLTEPASLHPVIDPILCLGCGACAHVCPEGDVIGIIDGKAALIEPTSCIGHGACRDACPRGAITLVFGTETRGVEIPVVDPDFQTNVRGLFIAGELGGMGLIRNAIEQGRQAVDSIARLDGMGQPDRLDLIIVGGGPAGFAASLAAIEKKLRFVTIEQESFGGTIAHFPRGKLVMTRPVSLPIVGKMPFVEVTKEELLGFWTNAARTAGLQIGYNERVDEIVPIDKGFAVTTTRQTYRSRAVLLAIGRRGTPRTLGVRGEELSKVIYRLIDAEQYKGCHVLVVGGGDSALEAASTIAEQPGATVVLSYRGDKFGRAKRRNRERVDAAIHSGRLTVLLQSNVTQIGPDRVSIECRGTLRTLRNDFVIVCTGGVLPTQLLKGIGVEYETKHGTK